MNVVTGELFSQHMAVSPPPLSSRFPRISLQMEQVVFTALAKDPGQRFACIQEFVRKLTEAIGAPSPGSSLDTYDHQYLKFNLGHSLHASALAQED